MKQNILKKLMLIAVLLTGVNAFAHDFEFGGIYYNITSSSGLTVEVTYKGSSSGSYSNEYSGQVTIPESVTYNSNTYSVTSIGSFAFRGCSGLTSVTIPNSVTSIGSFAFRGCSGLTSVTIPNSVTSIGDSAFRGCSGLTSVTIGNSVTSIGDSAFRDCSGLTSVVFNAENCTTMGSSNYPVFENCTNLTSITIGDKVKNIPDYAFYYCIGLTSVTCLNTTPPTCGTNVFSNVSVENITLEIPEVSVSLYKSADTWKGFGKIDVLKPVDEYGLLYNFISETELEVIAGTEKYSGSIVIPSKTTIYGKAYNVTKIGSSAFSGCSGLTSVTIPNSVTSIGDEAFEDCSGLESIIVESGNTVYDSRDNCNAIIATSTNTLITGCKNTTIPESVTSIGDDAFYNCSGLTSVTIPNSVTSIGYSAFSGCSGLTSVTIPNSVTSIGYSAFYGCSGLTSVNIPNSVERLGNYTFESCSALASVSLGNTLSKIGIYAFKGCGNITKIESMNPIAPIITETVFESKVYENAQLVVPLGASESYQSATGWSKFTNTSAGYKVTVDYSSTGGVVSVNDSNETTVSVDFDTKVDFVITPKEGFEIEKVTLNEVDITENVVDGKYSLEKLAEDVTFAVTFRKLYTIATIFNSEEGIVTINGQEKNPIQVSFDTKVDFEITPNEGYEIDKVLLNEVDITTDVVEGKYTIENATENVKLTVTFELKTFALVLKCSEAGAFKRILSYGETATYEIVPSENWEISTVTFNGTDVTTELVDNVFTTPEITEDSELSVVFVDVPTSVYSLYDTKDVKVYASQQTVKINGLEENMPVTVYDTSGHMEYNSVSTDSEMNINMNKSGAYLVKVGERTFKVIL